MDEINRNLSDSTKPQLGGTKQDQSLLEPLKLQLATQSYDVLSEGELARAGRELE